MAKRLSLKRKSRGGQYFSAPIVDHDFIPTGCKMLDLALGGGWAERRIANVVGDKSTGKTLLAIEASVNFTKKYKDSIVRFRECESAFMPSYAAALGLPLRKVDFGEPLDTIEDLFEDLTSVISKAKYPELYIVDSLDALSDRAELERKMDEGSYGMTKAKNLSQLFRRLVRDMASSNVTLLIVSQVRSKIGLSFGRGTTRSGGRALDFYASQVVYLTSGSTVAKTIKGVKRIVGVDVKARVDKNKISLPFREAAFQMLFGYGVDDTAASLDWLQQVGHLSDLGIKNKISKKELKVIKRQYTSGTSEPDIHPSEIRAAVTKRWYEIETSFLPSKSKY